MNANRRESMRNRHWRPFAVNFPADFETIRFRTIPVFRGSTCRAGSHRPSETIAFTSQLGVWGNVKTLKKISVN